MEKHRFRGIILIKKQDEHIRPAALFAFALAVCLPFHTLTISGLGLLLLISLPLLLFCAPALLRQVNQKIWDKADVLLILFMIYGLIGYLWTPEFSFESLYNYIKKIILVVCLLYLPLNRRECNWIWGGSIIASIFVSFFLISGQQIIYQDNRSILAIFGTEQDPNYLGLLFVIPTALFTHFFLNEKKLVHKVVSALSAILIVYSIFLTGSRGAILGIATTFAINIVSKFKTLGKKIIFCSVMVLLVTIVVDYLLPFLSPELAARFTLQSVVESRGTHRLDIWEDTFRVMISAPQKLLFGFGTGSSIPLVGVATHNFILQIVLELGLFGTSLFFGFLWRWTKRLIKQDILCFSSVMGCMALAMSLSVNTILYFWIPLIFSIICSKARNAMNTEAYDQ